MSRSRRILWLVGLGALFLLLWKTTEVPLIDPDETRYARTTYEMLEAGEWVVPTFEGQPRLVKPPLFHWVQNYSFRILGPSEFSARLPSVLATLFSLWLVAWVAMRRFGEEGATWAAIFFATSPLVMVVGRIGILDSLLSLHVLAAISIDIAEPDETGPSRGMVIGALLGLGFLVKGPVAVILPLLLILAGRSASGRNVVPGLGPAVACGAALVAIVIPWGLSFLKQIGAFESWDLLRHEVLDRYFAGTAHVEPATFFLKVIAVGFFPWVVPLIAAIFRTFNRRKDPTARTAVYAAAAFLAGVVFFSLGRGKLPTYLLPLAPLAALLVTWELSQELRKPKERTWVPLLMSASLAIFGFALWIVAARYEQPPVPTVAFAASILYLAGAAVAGVGVLRTKPRVVFGSAAITSFCFLALLFHSLMPTLVQERSVEPLVAKAPQLASERPLLLYAMELPGIAWHLDRVPIKVREGDLTARVSEFERPVIVTDRRDYEKLSLRTQNLFKKIADHGKFLVLEPRVMGGSTSEIP